MSIKPLRYRLFEKFGYLRPIHDIPPVLQVVRAFILVAQIIGMFPHIVGEDRRTAEFDHVHQRIVLVRGCDDFHGVFCRDDQPDPAGANCFVPASSNFFLNSSNVPAESSRAFINSGEGVDVFRRHEIPRRKYGSVTACIVADAGVIFRHMLDNIVDGFSLERVILRHFLVQIVDIRLVVFSVVKLHRLLVDGLGQRACGIGKFRHGEGACRCGGRSRSMRRGDKAGSRPFKTATPRGTVAR